MCETQAMAERVRVAYTVMQSWHRVPGGTATSVLSLARALGERDDVDVVGIGPWIGGQPSEPWMPPIPVRRLPGPYQAIYEAWNRGLLPPTLAVGDVDVAHRERRRKQTSIPCLVDRLVRPRQAADRDRRHPRFRRLPADPRPDADHVDIVTLAQGTRQRQHRRRRAPGDAVPTLHHRVRHTDPLRHRLSLAHGAAPGRLGRLPDYSWRSPRR